MESKELAKNTILSLSEEMLNEGVDFRKRDQILSEVSADYERLLKHSLNEDSNEREIAKKILELSGIGVISYEAYERITKLDLVCDLGRD